MKCRVLLGHQSQKQTYLLCRFHILKIIKDVATKIPQLEIVLIQMKSGNETVRSTRRTIVRSWGTCEGENKDVFETFILPDGNDSKLPPDGKVFLCFLSSYQRMEGKLPSFNLNYLPFLQPTARCWTRSNCRPECRSILIYDIVHRPFAQFAWALYDHLASWKLQLPEIEKD